MYYSTLFDRTQVGSAARDGSALPCHASPAPDARLPSASGWCPGLTALPSPSLRSIRAACDGSALPVNIL